MKNYFIICLLIIIIGISSCGSKDQKKSTIVKGEYTYLLLSYVYHGSGIFEINNTRDIASDLSSLMKKNKNTLEFISLTLLKTGGVDTIEVSDSSIQRVSSGDSYILLCKQKSDGYIKNPGSIFKSLKLSTQLTEGVDSIKIY